MDVNRLIASIRYASQAQDGLAATDRAQKTGENRQKAFTTRKSKKTKSTSNLIILLAIIIGICLILITTLVVIFGPKMIANINGDQATPTGYVQKESTSTPTDLPTATTEAATDFPITPTTAITISEPTQTKPPTFTPTEPSQPKWGFQDNCIDAETWTFYPSSGFETDTSGCLQISNAGFYTQNQSLSISILNPTGNDRVGIYAPITGDAVIEFDIRIDQLTTTNNNELGSLGFGIISTQPVDTETDGFIFYVIESSINGYPVFPKKAERGVNPRAPYILIGGEEYRYKLGTNQRISFFLEGNQLAIYIDEQFIRSTKLTFGNQAFFIGYKFENLGSLDATLSNLSIVEK
jgi:hypothetical protein